MKTATLALLTLILAAAPGSGQVPEMFVIPVAAFNQPGYGSNMWSTELRAINLGPEPSELEIVEFIPGAMEPREDFAPCEEALWTLDPDQELTVPVGLQQCAGSFVGAYVVRVGPWISVRSRIVNHASMIDPWHPTTNPLRGFGQEIPVFPLPEAPVASAEVVLWPMTWHWNRCTQPRAFDSYVGVVNYGDTPGTIWIGEEGDNAAVIVDGVEVRFGAALYVAAHSWAQYRLHPYDSPFSDCRDAEPVAIPVRSEGPLMVYGSVVDRTSQDPRTVIPTLRPSGATNP